MFRSVLGLDGRDVRDVRGATPSAVPVTSHGQTYPLQTQMPIVSPLRSSSSKVLALRGTLVSQLEFISSQLMSLQASMDRFDGRLSCIEKQMTTLPTPSTCASVEAKLDNLVTRLTFVEQQLTAPPVTAALAAMIRPEHYDVQQRHRRSESSSSLAGDDMELSIQQIMSRSRTASLSGACKTASLLLFPEDASYRELRQQTSESSATACPAAAGPGAGAVRHIDTVPTTTASGSVGSGSPSILQEVYPDDPDPNYEEEWSVLAPTPVMATSTRLQPCVPTSASS